MSTPLHPLSISDRNNAGNWNKTCHGNNATMTMCMKFVFHISLSELHSDSKSLTNVLHQHVSFSCRLSLFLKM